MIRQVFHVPNIWNRKIIWRYCRTSTSRAVSSTFRIRFVEIRLLELKYLINLSFFILILRSLVGLTTCRNIENACSYDGDFNPFDICVKKCLKFISRTNLHGLRLKIRSDSDLQLHQTINTCTNETSKRSIWTTM